MERRASEESIKSILHNFKDKSPEDTAAINSMVMRAKEAIDTHTINKFLLGAIRVDILLHSLIDYAIDDGGKHYIACAILVCEKEAEPVEFLVQLAEVWLTYLLYPGEHVSLHSNHSRLREPQLKQVAKPKGARRLPSKLQALTKQDY